MWNKPYLVPHRHRDCCWRFVLVCAPKRIKIHGANFFTHHPHCRIIMLSSHGEFHEEAQKKDEIHFRNTLETLVSQISNPKHIFIDHNGPQRDRMCHQASLIYESNWNINWDWTLIRRSNLWKWCKRPRLFWFISEQSFIVTHIGKRDISNQILWRAKLMKNLRHL